MISGEQYEELDPDDQCRCVRQPAGDGSGWLTVCMGGLPCINQYLANSVRFARTGESANCRIMLDWKFNGYPPDERVYEHRCVLVSRCKTEKGHEWRLGRAFAERNALEEDSAEESMSEEEEEPVRTRPKRIPGDVQKPAPTGDHEYEERMVTNGEGKQMLLGEQVGLMLARLEDQRMINVELVVHNVQRYGYCTAGAQGNRSQGDGHS